jgi:hypothetical protein
MTHQELADEFEPPREMVSWLPENSTDPGVVTQGRKRVAIEDPRLFEEVLDGR